MKRKIAIYGAGGLGKELAFTIKKYNRGADEDKQWQLVGFYDDDKPVGTKISHVGTVLGGVDALNAVTEPLAVAIAIGNPKLLKAMRERITNPNIYFPNLIMNKLWLLDEESVSFGEGNIMRALLSLSCDVKIGNFNVFTGLVKIAHDCVVGDYNVFMPDARISGGVTIGNGNLFGARCLVLPGIKVGNDVTIGAGSVLMTKPKDGNTYIGVPARKFHS